MQTAILVKLTTGQCSRSHLIASLGAAPSTLDDNVEALVDGGLVTRRLLPDRPPQTILKLAPGPGLDLLIPLRIASRWLGLAGLGALYAEDPRLTRLATIVSWAWRHRLIDQLTDAPKSATELIACSGEASSRTVHKYLRALSALGIVESQVDSQSRRKLYRLSRAGNALVGPLAAFVRWELHHRPGTASLLTLGDVRTALTMACNLIDPARMREGRYAFLVKLASGRPAGLLIEVEGASLRMLKNPRSRFQYGIHGEPIPWLDAILDPRPSAGTGPDTTRLHLKPADCNFLDLVHEEIAAG